MGEQTAWTVVITAIIIQGAMGMMLFRLGRRLKYAEDNLLPALNDFLCEETLTDAQKVWIVRTILEGGDLPGIIERVKAEHHTASHQAWIIANQTVKE